MSKRPDWAYLWEMMNSARQAAEWTAPLTLDAFLKDELHRAAVERAMLIIGEAANRVSLEFKAQHPEVPWQRMVSLRNILVHAYHDLNGPKIWSIARNDAPALVAMLMPLVPTPPSGQEPLL